MYKVSKRCGNYFKSARKIEFVSESFRRFVGVRVGVADSRNKHALRTRLLNLSLKSQISITYSFRDIRVHIYDF